MSVSFSVWGVRAREGKIHVIGEATFTASADPGEEIQASDVMSNLSKLYSLHMTHSGDYHFEYIPSSDERGTIKIVEASGSPLTMQKFTAASLTTRFRAVGRANLS